MTSSIVLGERDAPSDPSTPGMANVRDAAALDAKGTRWTRAISARGWRTVRS